jgi:diguanylate cyclase (GGDEF)-like protein
MMAFLPHFVLIALVGAASILFLQKGSSRRDLLAMGFASLFATVWMFSVVMIDIQVHAGKLPGIWLGLSYGALLPTLFFVYLSILTLEQYYSPQATFTVNTWLPVAGAIVVLGFLQILDPQLFVSAPVLALPPTDRMTVKEVVGLKFTLGPAYYFLLALAGYVVFEIAVRFPRIVEAMQLPEAERRTRLLLSLGMLAAFWSAAFDVLPSLFSTIAPSFLRLVGPALGVAGAVYAMVLSRALDPKAVTRNTIFYAFRILIVTTLTALMVIPYRQRFADLGPRWALISVLAGIIVIDFAINKFKPLMDRLAMRKTYNSTEAVNSFVHELLVLRDLREFTATTSDFISKTLGVPEVRIWVPHPNDALALLDMEHNARLPLRAETKNSLVERNSATTPEDLQLDPSLYHAQEEIGALFADINSEVILPLIDEKRVIGLITLGIKESFDEFYEQDLEFLDRIKEAIALSLGNTQIYELARTGKPVKVLARDEFDENLEGQWKKARRYNESAAIVLFQVADTAAFEREHGEGTVAEFIRNLGEQLRPTLRARDLPAYFNASTLAIFLPQTPMVGAEIAARRLRGWLEATEAPVGSKRVKSRFVLGISARDDSMNKAADLVRLAEDSLAEATALLHRTNA